MVRKITALVVVIALAGVVAGPVEAKRKKKRPGPVAISYYMNWSPDHCDVASGSLGLQPHYIKGCALYFPGPTESIPFTTSEGTPVVLDATQKIPVDFVLDNLGTVAADFEVVLTGTVNGEDKEIASGVQTVLVGPNGDLPLHYDLEPDTDLHNTAFDSLTLTVTCKIGATLSQIDLSKEARMVIHARR